MSKIVGKIVTKEIIGTLTTNNIIGRVDEGETNITGNISSPGIIEGRLSHAGTITGIISNQSTKTIGEALDALGDRVDAITTGGMENVNPLEIVDARHGKSSLSENLWEMKEGIHVNKTVHPSVKATWTPPTLPDTLRGNGKVPSGYNPDEHLDALMDPLVDGVYVTKSLIGLDQSEEYTMRRYDFTPEHYEKTIVISGCLHGNEYSGFYSLTQLLDLLVNNWKEYPQLAYIRKNVRVIALPILNMWGFANQSRQNSRQVDLNRNMDYAWETFSHDTPGMTYYKGVQPFSERETRNIKAVFDTIDDAVAFLDFHSITTIGPVEYCIFYPRFTEQNNEPFIKALWELHEDPEHLVYGSSSLPSLTNYVSENYKATSLLCEVVNGIDGSTRTAPEMTRMARFFGNLIIKGAVLEHKGDVETLEEPYTRYYAYDRSPGNYFGVEGDYEGTPGEPIPAGYINHDVSTLRTYSNNYAYTGQTSMRMMADNQVSNARLDIPEFLVGRHYLWLMRRRVFDITLGEFQMSVYTIGGFTNRADLASTTVPDTDWMLVGGVFRGRNEGVRLLYGSSNPWTGEAYVDTQLLVEISREEYDMVADGKVTLEEMADKYNFDYQNAPPKIQVSPQKNYATLSHFEDRIDVNTQGIYLMDGFITFTITERAEVGFILQTYQPYSPESKWRLTKDENLFGTRRWYDPGTHTVPVMSQLFAEVTNITANGWPKRTGEAVIRIRGLLSNGQCTIENVRYKATFFPSMSGQRYTAYDSSRRELEPSGNRYTTLFPEFLDENEAD